MSHKFLPMFLEPFGMFSLQLDMNQELQDHISQVQLQLMVSFEVLLCLVQCYNKDPIVLSKEKQKKKKFVFFKFLYFTRKSRNDPKRLKGFLIR